MREADFDAGDKSGRRGAPKFEDWLFAWTGRTETGRTDMLPPTYTFTEIGPVLG
jgi:hypothetical protein